MHLTYASYVKTPDPAPVGWLMTESISANAETLPYAGKAENEQNITGQYLVS